MTMLLPNAGMLLYSGDQVSLLLCKRHNLQKIKSIIIIHYLIITTVNMTINYYPFYIWILLFM